MTYRFKLPDLIIAVLILFISSAPLFSRIPVSDAKHTAVITYPDSSVREVDLSADSEFTAAHVTFKTGNNTIRALKSDCPGQTCVNTGTISAPGSVIICAHNKVAAQVRGRPDDGIDAVSY